MSSEWGKLLGTVAPGDGLAVGGVVVEASLATASTPDEFAPLVAEVV
jgi:hypothetical protein